MARIEDMTVVMTYHAEWGATASAARVWVARQLVRLAEWVTPGVRVTVSTKERC